MDSEDEVLSSVEEHVPVGSSYEIYQCNYALCANKCSFKTFKRHNMQLHLRHHLNISRYRCLLCSETRRSLINIKKHYNKSHPSIHQLKYEIVHIKEYSSKLGQMTDNTRVKLDTPKKYFPNTGYPKIKHFTWFKKVNGEFSCRQCKYKNTDYKCMRKHLQSQHRIYRYQCSLCDYKHFEATVVRKHARRHKSNAQVISIFVNNSEFDHDVLPLDVGKAEFPIVDTSPMTEDVNLSEKCDGTDMKVEDATCMLAGGKLDDNTEDIVNNEEMSTGSICDRTGIELVFGGTDLNHEKNKINFEKRILATMVNQSDLPFKEEGAAVVPELQSDYTNASRQTIKFNDGADVELLANSRGSSGVSRKCRKRRLSGVENIKFDVIKGVIQSNKETEIDGVNKRLRTDHGSCTVSEINNVHAETDINQCRHHDDKENEDTKTESTRRSEENSCKMMDTEEVLNSNLMLRYKIIGKLIHCSYCDVKVEYTNSRMNIYNHLLTVHDVFRYKCKLCSCKTIFMCFMKDHFRRLHKRKTCFYTSVPAHPTNITRSAGNEVKAPSSNVDNKKDSLPATKNIDLSVSEIQKVRTNVIFGRDFRKEKKLFVCTMCDHKLGSMDAMYYHISAKHKVSRFGCTLCDYSNNYKCRINNHFDTMHLEENIHLDEIMNNMKIDNMAQESENVPCAGITSSSKSICNIVDNESEHIGNNKDEIMNNMKIDNMAQESENVPCAGITSSSKSICNIVDNESEHIGNNTNKFVKSNLKQLNEIVANSGNVGKSNGKKKSYMKCSKRYRRRLYFCSQCEYRSKYSSDVYRHMQNVHHQPRYRCTYCYAGFFSKALVEKHCRTTHRKLKEQYRVEDLNIREERIGTKHHIFADKCSNSMYTADSVLDVNANLCYLEETVKNKLKVKCYDSLEKNIRSKLCAGKGFFCFHKSDANMMYYNEAYLPQEHKHTAGKTIAPQKQFHRYNEVASQLGLEHASHLNGSLAPQDGSANFTEPATACISLSDAPVQCPQAVCTSNCTPVHEFDIKEANNEVSNNLELSVGNETADGKPELLLSKEILLDDSKVLMETLGDGRELKSNMSGSNVFIRPRFRNKNAPLSTKAKFLLGLARNETRSVDELLRKADNRMESMVEAAKLQIELSRRLSNNLASNQPTHEPKKLGTEKAKAKRKGKMIKRRRLSHLNYSSAHQEKQAIRDVFNAAKEEHRSILNKIQIENKNANTNIFNSRPKLFIHPRKRQKNAEQSSRGSFLHGLVLNTPASISSLLDSVKDETDMTSAINLELELARRLRRLKKGNKCKTNAISQKQWGTVGKDRKSKAIGNVKRKSYKCKGRRTGNPMEGNPAPSPVVGPLPGPLAVKDGVKGKTCRRENQRYKCGWCAFRSVHSATILRHQLKKHPEEELDIVKLKGKFHKRTSPGLSSVSFSCESCNFSASLRHQLHLHNDRHHQGASNRDGVTDCESYYSRSSPLATISEMNFLKETCKQNMLEVKCVDFLQAGLDHIEQAMKIVGVTKICVDILTEEDFVSMATKFRENVTFNDETKAGFLPVDIADVQEKDIRKLICS